MKQALGIILLLISFRSYSQDVSVSRTTSYFTHVYRITDEEALRLITKGTAGLNQSMMHTLVTIYPTDSVFDRVLTPGHYLFIHSEANHLNVAYHPVNNLSMYILDNSRDLMMVFHDSLGKEVLAKSVFIRNRSIAFNKALNAYRLPKTNKQGLIKATFNGHTNFFQVERRYNNTLPARAKRTVLNRLQMRHVISPVTYLYRSTRALVKWGYFEPPGIYYKARNWFSPRRIKGYVALNKPMYKPGDTVMAKAFLTTRKGRPVNRKLQVYLTGYSAPVQKKLGEVKPYRKGAYIFNFVLKDSLKLKLDKEYSLTFRSSTNFNYPQAGFSFEQYELNQNFFTISPLPDAREDAPATIFLKGQTLTTCPCLMCVLRFG
jgi:hypothetical protein